MKRYIGLLLLISILLLTGCGKQVSQSAPAAALDTPAPEATVPAPTEPESVPGRVLIPHLGLVLGTLPMGEQVSVISEEGKYCLADTSVGQGLIEKRLLRLAGEPEFEGYIAYAKSGAVLYKDYRMLGEGEALDTNTKLTVLQELGGGVLVQLGDKRGYMAADMLSKTPVMSGDWSGYSGGGGGSSGSNDGGDISLTAAVITGERVRLIASSSLATVLADGAEVYADFLDMGDTVKVTNSTDEICTVYLDGKLLSVARSFVALEGDAPFESYTGYVQRDAPLYEDHTMAGESLAQLQINKEITVLGDFGRCCLVEADGTLGFMNASAVGKHPVSYGSNSGGGTSENWTPPTL